MQNVSISSAPGPEQLSQIETWLLAEHNQKREGFYCNWNIIRRAYDQQRMMVISVADHCVGFAIWQEHEVTASIDIMEIKPGERKNGLGLALTEALFNLLRAKGVVVADLQCAPAESEPVWRKMGFVDFPDSFSRPVLENKILYKILVPITAPGSTSNDEVAIALWNDEPFKARSKDPVITWAVPLNDTFELTRPIIHPSLPDWQIGWRMNGKDWKTKKVKYFNNESSYYNQFLVITSLHFFN